jgi:hypothetical protein
MLLKNDGKGVLKVSIISDTILFYLCNVLKSFQFFLLFQGLFTSFEVISLTEMSLGGDIPLGSLEKTHNWRTSGDKPTDSKARYTSYLKDGPHLSLELSYS